MMETNLMRGWAGIVESVALFALTILAIRLILGAVKSSDVLKNLGAIILTMILLLILPGIMVSAFFSMSYWQIFGLLFLGIMTGLALRRLWEIGKR
jgi:hypothetical protein